MKVLSKKLQHEQELRREEAQRSKRAIETLNDEVRSLRAGVAARDAEIARLQQAGGFYEGTSERGCSSSSSSSSAEQGRRDPPPFRGEAGNAAGMLVQEGGAGTENVGDHDQRPGAGGLVPTPPENHAPDLSKGDHDQASLMAGLRDDVPSDDPPPRVSNQFVPRHHPTAAIGASGEAEGAMLEDQDLRRREVDFSKWLKSSQDLRDEEIQPAREEITAANNVWKRLEVGREAGEPFQPKRRRSGQAMKLISHTPAGFWDLDL